MVSLKAKAAMKDVAASATVGTATAVAVAATKATVMPLGMAIQKHNVTWLPVKGDVITHAKQAGKLGVKGVVTAPVKQAVKAHVVNVPRVKTAQVAHKATAPMAITPTPQKTVQVSP